MLRWLSIRMPAGFLSTYGASRPSSCYSETRFLHSNSCGAAKNPVALSEKSEHMAKAAAWDELYERLLAIYEARNRKGLDEMVKGSLAEFDYLLVIHKSPITANLADLGLDRIANARDFCRPLSSTVIVEAAR